MAGLAALLVGLYLALHACFAPEFLSRITGVSLPVNALLAALLPVIWLAISPQPFRFLQTGIARVYILVLVWWMACALIMSFKGHALEIVEYGIRFHTAPLVFCGLLITLKRVRTALLGYSSGFMIALLLCWKYGELDATGRFVVAGTSLGNPNDLALNLLYGAAFLSILLVNSSVIKRLLFAACLFVSLYFVLKTGSRANFLTLGVTLLVAFKVATARARMLMVALAVFLALVMAVAIPKHTWTRLTTFETASDEELARDRSLSGAIGSTEARKELQIRAVKLTLQHPVFGVGPRMFVYALYDFMRAEGFPKGNWQHAHNTYLEIAAETGIIGAGLYITCMLWCLRTNYRCAQACKRRADLQPNIAQSSSLLFATVVYAFGTLFCSIVYIGQMPFLLALTAANWLALRDAGAFSTPARVPELALHRSFRNRSSK
jgi:O-antigen ligase